MLGLITCKQLSLREQWFLQCGRCFLNAACVLNVVAVVYLGPIYGALSYRGSFSPPKALLMSE